MSITVTVAGVDRSEFVSKVAPANWDDTLNGRGTGSITFNVPFDQLATFRPVDGQTILIAEDLGGGPEPRFGGFLVEPEQNELPDEEYVIFTCGMQDNNAIADRRIITASYDGVAFEDIVSDILDNPNTDGLTGEFITSGGVQAGAALTIEFPTLYVTEAFNDLAVAIGGWWWDIDDAKDLTFAPRTAVPAPPLTNANVLKRTVKLRPVKEKYRNVEVVLAGKDEFPVVAMFEDTTEITARGTLEGTSGRYEHIEERQDILDGVIAEELAEDLVERFGEVTLLFECVTRDPGYASGQEVDVTFPNLELNATAFLIDSVSAQIVYADEDGTEPEIWYSIHAITGDPFGGWMEHFRKRPGSAQERDIVPAPGVTVECDPGVVVHDPPPGPLAWFQGPASGTLDFTPSVPGITHQLPGQGGFLVTARRGPVATPRQSIVELYAIDANEQPATSPSVTVTWDELVASSFKADMVVKSDNTKIALIERGSGGADPIFIVVDIDGQGKQGHVTATGLTDSNTGFEGAWVGDHVYVPEQGTGSVFVFDVADPDNPTLETEFATSLGDARSVVASSDGTYLFVCGGGSNDIVALDISDPTSISEVDSITLTGDYNSIDLRSDDDLLSAFERADASNLRYLILPVTVGGGGSTFGTAVEDTVAEATSVMDGYSVVFENATAHVFASKPATSPVNSQRSYTFTLNDAESAFTLTETFAYNHAITGNIGPARSTIGHRVVQVFGFNTDAQVTYGVQTYPTCVELSTLWPLTGKFGGTDNKTYQDGDLLVGSEPESLVRLALGADGDHLSIVDGAVAWAPSALRGYIDGLETENAADADHDVTVNPGVCADSLAGNDRMIALDVAITKQIDAAFAEGTNQGGMATGSVAADTEYNLIVIEKDSDGTVDVMFDTSATGANAPSGWAARRRIGSVFTDASSNIRAYRQIDDTFFFDADVQDLNDATGTPGTFESAALTVPPNQIALLYAYAEAGTSAKWAGPKIRHSDATAGASFYYGGVVYLSAPSAGIVGHTDFIAVPVSASSEVEYTIESDGGWRQFRILTVGWHDDRGRNG